MGNALLAVRSPRFRVTWLLSCSLAFYAWWDPRFLALLIVSITINYMLGLLIETVRCGKRRADATLTVAIVANLSVLAYYKYAFFLSESLGFDVSNSYMHENILLPLGISFFTFEQIGYLVDVRRGESAERVPVRYALFVAFFPRLVAGPILRAHELLPQLGDALARTKPPYQDVAIGITLFFIGLFKKTFLADGIAPYASPVFDAAENGQDIDFIVAWIGALAYTFQLYFDFSAYSDMAIGCARCLGIRFPMNFFSPYKARSIIEFWHRWHMTLSRFLKDYLYIPLGGSRCGLIRRYTNLLLTMLLGGLWHGANWTFVVWGGLHGLYLIVNHGWRALCQRHGPLASLWSGRFGVLVGWSLTFLSVVVAWVFFRAPSLDGAFSILAGMAGMHGIVLPTVARGLIEPLGLPMEILGLRFGNVSGSFLLGGMTWVAALLAVATLAPNPYQILERWQPTLRAFEAGRAKPELRNSRLDLKFQWRPSPAWAVFVAVLAVLGFVSISRGGEFLYWQF